MYSVPSTNRNSKLRSQRVLIDSMQWVWKEKKKKISQNRLSAEETKVQVQLIHIYKSREAHNEANNRASGRCIIPIRGKIRLKSRAAKARKILDN